MLLVSALNSYILVIIQEARCSATIFISAVKEMFYSYFCTSRAYVVTNNQDQITEKMKRGRDNRGEKDSGGQGLHHSHLSPPKFTYQ